MECVIVTAAGGVGCSSLWTCCPAVWFPWLSSIMAAWDEEWFTSWTRPPVRSLWLVMPLRQVWVSGPEEAEDKVDFWVLCYHVTPWGCPWSMPCLPPRTMAMPISVWVPPKAMTVSRSWDRAVLSMGLCWCPWPMLSWEVMQISVVCATAWYYIDVHGPYHHWESYWSEWHVQVHATTKGHVCLRPYCRQGLCWFHGLLPQKVMCMSMIWWPARLPEIMLPSVGHSAEWTKLMWGAVLPFEDILISGVQAPSKGLSSYCSQEQCP